MIQLYRQSSEGKYQCFSAEVSDHRLSAQVLVRLIGELNETAQKIGQVRTGRGSYKIVSLSEGFDVQVRGFLRGGWLRFINNDIFWVGSKEKDRYRPVVELVNVSKLYLAKVNVPLVLGAAVESILNGLAYRAYICYEAIPEAKNLLAVGREMPPEELNRIAFDAGKEAGKMLNAGVMHRDLHVGNVLLDKNQQVVLIDFDKSYCIEGNNKYYATKLIERWKRSVLKHSLPDEIVDQFTAGLMEEIK